jgi:hypothetical protein
MNSNSTDDPCTRRDDASSLSILAIEATRLHIIIAQVIHANFKLSQSVIDSLFPLQFLTLG